MPTRHPFRLVDPAAVQVDADREHPGTDAWMVRAREFLARHFQRWLLGHRRSW